MANNKKNRVKVNAEGRVEEISRRLSRTRRGISGLYFYAFRSSSF